jgi:hypothetical protein
LLWRVRKGAGPEERASPYNRIMTGFNARSGRRSIILGYLVIRSYSALPVA